MKAVVIASLLCLSAIAVSADFTHFHKVTSHPCLSTDTLVAVNAWIEKHPARFDSRFEVFIEFQATQDATFAKAETVNYNGLDALHKRSHYPQEHDLPANLEVTNQIIKLKAGDTFVQSFLVGPFQSGRPQHDPHTQIYLRDARSRNLMCLELDFISLE